MRNFLARVVGSLVMLWAISGYANADGSWQGIPFGATVDETLAIGKSLGVSRVDSPKRIPPGPNARNGLYDPLKIDSYEISAAKYKVSLVFDAKTDQLWAVVLKFTGEGAEHQFPILMQAMTEKYGQPVSAQNGGSSITRVWHDKQARITLWYIPTASHLTLNYEPPSRAKNSKL